MHNARKIFADFSLGFLLNCVIWRNVFLSFRPSFLKGLWPKKIKN
ncbi:hypothetical protein BREVNS_1035 [Brevinematales bacterium NS]|nr:hypothetical protein BREVNS_1035 [Brevinematales bacterium NS]